MRILLTNDDGYDAPGLAALSEIAGQWGDVLVVAPATEQSYTGHRVTTRDVLRPVEYAPRRFFVNGTPADCVRVALRALHLAPDVVLSGINRGGNLGADIYMSGTVAAAREAAFLGVPSIAVSQYIDAAYPLDWSRTAILAVRALSKIGLAGDNSHRVYWNVNLPHPAPHADLSSIDLLECIPDAHPLDVRFEAVDGGFRFAGRYAARPRESGRDAALCFQGAVTLSRLQL